MRNRQKIFQIIITSLFVLLVINLLFTFGIGELAARPGGGHSYSGGSSGGGGGGDGLVGLLIAILLELPPQISVPIIIAIFVLAYINQKRKMKNGVTISSAPTLNTRINQNRQIKSSIEMLKANDRNFSEVIFLDFISSLYNKYYTYLGKPEFKNIAPFFSKNEVQKSASSPKDQTINEIVIGSVNITNLFQRNGYQYLEVDINANYSLIKNNKKRRVSMREKWTMMRKDGVLSPEPDAMRRLTCPACGGSNDFTDNGNCNFCGNLIESGEKQWAVAHRTILESKLFNASGLAHYEQEQGTSLPTIYQPALSDYFNSLIQISGSNPKQWQENFLKSVVHTYFTEIYDAWSKNNLLSVRNLLSDRTYENFSFWIDAYKRAGLRNKLDNTQIKNIQFVKIDIDKFYISVTVRIYASAMDYVLNRENKVVGGSARRARSFSEYWTFVRSRKVQKDNFDHSKCPSCGAPADKIGQAGVCEYCNSKISTGDFSWVLAIITQDEEYSG